MVDNVTRPATTKDIWEILHSLAPMVASIAVPLVIAWVGSSYNASIKDSENRIRYVELAVAQLRSPPTLETAALREWAVELLDSQSPVKLPSAAKAQLKSGVLPLVISATAPGAVLVAKGSGSGCEPSVTNNNLQPQSQGTSNQ